MPPLNPNHHLWRNGRLWWIAFTVIHDGWRQERIRRSLGTASLAEARRRRDLLLGQLAAIPNLEVAALRASPSASHRRYASAEPDPALAADGAV
jgi:hypothetical protein